MRPRASHAVTPLILSVPCLWMLLATGCGDLLCETIANPDSPSTIQVDNSSSDTIAWSVEGYPLYAIVRPGECNRMGVQSGAFDVALALCDDEDCSAELAQRSVTGDLAEGETYEIDVDGGFFE